MTNTVNPQDPNLLYNSYNYDRTEWPYKRRDMDVRIGEDFPMEFLKTGTQIILNGEKAVVMASHSKNTLVRIHSTQECVMVPNVATATALSYGGWQDCGIPKVGEFVEVRKGEYKGSIGVVFTEGLNSTYVAFPGNRNRGLKFSAKDLIIREDVSLVTY